MTVRVGRARVRPRAAARGSFELFYEEHWPAVVAVIGALCRDVAIAEELAQEAFLRAYARWHKVATLDRPDLWVRRVALNLAVSRFRRLQAEARALARTATRRQNAASPSPVDAMAFWDALRALPARQAQVASLFYVDDLSVAQVAQVLGRAEGTVKAHLHAARGRLRDSLDESGRAGHDT